MQELLEGKRKWESECDEWRSSPPFALRIRQGSTTIEESTYAWLLVGAYGLSAGEDLLIEMTSDELANISLINCNDRDYFYTKFTIGGLWWPRLGSICKNGYEFHTKFTAPTSGDYALFVERKSSEKTTVDVRVPELWSSIERQWVPPTGPEVQERPTSLDNETAAPAGPDLVHWEILPPGEHPFPRILEYCERLKDKDQHRRIDSERLRLIEKLGPTGIYRGLAEFDGYFVFSFSELDTAILDCPVVGNAVYLIRGDWAALSRLTKAELLTEQSEKVTRVVHSGDWFSRVKMLIGIDH